MKSIYEQLRGFNSIWLISDWTLELVVCKISCMVYFVQSAWVVPIDGNHGVWRDLLNITFKICHLSHANIDVLKLNKEGVLKLVQSLENYLIYSYQQYVISKYVFDWYIIVISLHFYNMQVFFFLYVIFILMEFFIYSM